MAAKWRYRAAAAAALVALAWAGAALGGFDVLRWGSPGTGSGQFSNVRDVAVGPTGDVFALDEAGGLGRVQRFKPGGAYVGSHAASSIGSYVAVGPLGTIYVSRTDGGGWVQKIDPAGVFSKEWRVPNPAGIAVGFGMVYVVSNGSEIRKYTVDGDFVASWPISPGEIFPGGRDLALDPGNNLYVAQNWGAVRKFSSTGVLLATGYTGLPSEINGVGVGPKSGVVWVSAEDSAAMVELSSALDKVLATVFVPDLSQPRGVAVGCTDAYVANGGKEEIVRLHPSGPAGLCLTGTVPRVWIPPIAVDPTKKNVSVRATCLGPGACKGVLKIQTVSPSCGAKNRRQRCLLGLMKFNFGAGKSIAVKVRLRLPSRHVLDGGVTLSATFSKGRGVLLPLDRVSLWRAASGLTLDCRQGTTPGKAVPFSGTLTPQVGGAPVRLVFSGPGGLLEVREAATDASSRFGTSFTPRAPGSYSALAYWRGGKTIAGARSNICGFQVAAPPPTTTTTTTGTTTTGTTTTTTAGRPDLVISDLTKDSATVKNIGTAAAGSFVLTVTTTAGPSQFQIEDLPAGSSAIVTFFCTAGAVSALADSANQVAESNETNNAAAITVIGCVG